MTLFLLFILLLAWYYFVLRRYNTLGFRLFSLFFFISAAWVYWWWTDWTELKQIEKQGIRTTAIVVQKGRDGAADLVEVSLKDTSGNDMIRSRTGGMSVEELAEITVNQPAAIRYSPASDTFFLENSFQRQRRDMPWFLLFPGVFLLLGSLCWIFLRGYRIHPHEGTVYEYMTDESGRVVLDDAGSESSKQLRKWSLISKFLQIFMRSW